MPTHGDGAPLVLTVDDRQRAFLAGHELFIGDLDALLDRLGELLPVSNPHVVITPNVDQVVGMRSDPDLFAAMADADLRIADGAPLVLLGRALGARGLQRLTGADLLPAAASRAAEAGWRIAVTGGAPGVSDLAASHLTATYGAEVVSVPFPVISSVQDPIGTEVVDSLKAAAPDIVFVCLGSPKQDVWVHHWRDRLPPAVYVGAGAAVDFAAGVKVRAPRAVQAVGAEWLFRLAQEPRRLAKRYLLRGPVFLTIIGRSAVEALRRG